ncbi:Short chain dehydrogenase domain-containing protein [Desulfonema limicola]|uniref:Short chain dehydrogenase domain-containing protein n=1 Tax=Desulfonema limicola TaxID=45656 RepID=A0A975BEE2_9BACT|nr:SDR family NAD(P)-dependent oxidoreductase [Desulfonema limicola]QTA83911.1 Short chain dehydrogenase domain-containing protein [Desulfonema limicola]
MSCVPVIIVTGASRGIGSEIARWLAKTGACLTLVARSETSLNEVAKDVKNLGGNAVVVGADIAGRDACFYAVRETLKHFGSIDGLINNAGILDPIIPIADVNPNAWTYNVEVNLFGAFYMAQAAIPELRKTKGRIINISSDAAEEPIEAWGAYCVSKAALTQFTRVLAVEELSITSISVRPGVVDTQMQAQIRKQGSMVMSQEKAAFFQRLKDEGKLMPPHIPARSIAWLALKAPKEMSGEFVEYDTPEISEPALELFGE